MARPTLRIAFPAVLFVAWAVASSCAAVPADQGVPAAGRNHTGAPPPYYRIVDLGPSGVDSEASAISDNGYIAGWVAVGAPPGVFHAMRWQWSAAGLASVDLDLGPGSRGMDVNNAGVVVGNVDWEIQTRTAFYWNGTGHQIGGLGAEAWGVNDAGVVVGSPANGDPWYMWTLAGGMQLMPVLGGWAATGFDINGGGQATGTSWVSGHDRAFFWDGSNISDIGTLGSGHFAYGNGINAAGHVCGLSTYADDDQHAHAFLWDGAQMHDLGTLGGTDSACDHPGHGINDQDSVVGWAHDPDGATKAFLHFAGTMYDLNVLALDKAGFDSLVTGLDINNNGCIVGWGDKQGTRHAFLAVPSLITTLVVPNVGGRPGQTVNLLATLTADGAPVSGKPIAFTVNGVPAGSATTGVGGVASLPYAIAEPVGTYPIGASFAAQANLLPASGTGTLIVGIPLEVWVDATWTGPDNCGGHTWQYDAFRKIQDGVDAVADGGIVHVADGTYPERVRIAKPITLDGAGSATTTTIAPPSRDAITLNPGSEGTVISGVRLAGTGRGILIYGVAGTPIAVRDCFFTAGLSEFIRLTNMATVDVDARTGNTFEGAPTDNAIEARVWHQLDDAALGFVDWGQGPLVTTLLQVDNVTRPTGKTAQLSARLSVGGAPLMGRTLAFTVGGWSGSAVSDASGIARIYYTVTQAPGVYPGLIQCAFAGTAVYQPCTGTGTLTVTRGYPSSIHIRERDQTLIAGQSQTYHVDADTGEDVTNQCLLYVSVQGGGTWNASTYTAEKAGPWVVSAVYDAIADDTLLTVNHATAEAVQVLPPFAQITAGALQVYTVRGTDHYGNTWDQAIPAADWTVSVVGGGTQSGAFDDANTYHSVAGDNNKQLSIVGKLGALSSAPVTLALSGGGPGFTLAWDRDTQGFYLCADPTNPQTGTPVPASGTYLVHGQTVVVSVTGGLQDQTAAITNCARAGTLRVRWYLNGGVLYRVYETSTIAGVATKSNWTLGQTFTGLTHTPGGYSAGPPPTWATLTGGAANQ